jgi:hypothetical protein
MLSLSKHKIDLGNTPLTFDSLLVGGFSFDLYPVYDHGLSFVINRIKNTVIAYSDTVTFFMGKLFRIESCRVGGGQP